MVAEPLVLPPFAALFARRVLRSARDSSVAGRSRRSPSACHVPEVGLLVAEPLALPPHPLRIISSASVLHPLLEEEATYFTSPPLGVGLTSP